MIIFLIILVHFSHLSQIGKYGLVKMRRVVGEIWVRRKVASIMGERETLAKKVILPNRLASPGSSSPLPTRAGSCWLRMGKMLTLLCEFHFWFISGVCGSTWLIGFSFGFDSMASLPSLRFSFLYHLCQLTNPTHRLPRCFLDRCCDTNMDPRSVQLLPAAKKLKN